MKRISILASILAVAVSSSLLASSLDLGISGGTYAWGNATELRDVHEGADASDNGQFDLGVFAEYGSTISGRIELRWNKDYLTEKGSPNYFDGSGWVSEKWEDNVNMDELMLPILLKVNVPMGHSFKFNVFGGPEVCLYRGMGSSVKWAETGDYIASGKSSNLDVVPFELDNSLGALFGFGVDKDFGAFSVGVKANAELVRFTTGNDPAGEAIWHRYNIQLDLGYSLFTGE